MTRRRGIIAAVLLALAILLPLLVFKITRKSPAHESPKAVTVSPPPPPVERKEPEPPKPPPMQEPAKPIGELTWQTLPRIVRYRNPMASREGGTRMHEERVLLEDGLTREEVAKVRAFINSIDRKLDKAFGD